MSEKTRREAIAALTSPGKLKPSHAAALGYLIRRRRNGDWQAFLGDLKLAEYSQRQACLTSVEEHAKKRFEREIAEETSARHEERHAR